MSLVAIVVIGRSGVGKSTACDFIAEAFNGTVLNVGNLINGGLETYDVRVPDRDQWGPVLEQRGLTRALIQVLELELSAHEGLVVLVPTFLGT